MRQSGEDVTQSEERRPEETPERHSFLHIRLRFLLLASIRTRRHAEVVHGPPTHTHSYRQAR